MSDTAKTAAMVETCLIVVERHGIDGREVLLGEKLRGFGAGRVVAPGGKIDAGETPCDAAARELCEETSLCLKPEELQYAGLVTFLFDATPGAGMCAHIYTTSNPAGAPAHSDEIAVTWTPVDAIPYDRMWPDAAQWLPRILDGEVVNIDFAYGPDGRTLRAIATRGV